MRMIDAHLEFTCKSLQCIEFSIHFGDLALEERLITPTFLTKLTNFGYPACHDGRTFASGVDQVAGPFLVCLNFLFERNIKFMRHFFTLALIVHDIHTVHIHLIFAKSMFVHRFQKVLKNIDFCHVLPRDKIHTAARLYFDGLHVIQHFAEHGIHLPAVDAATVQLKAFLNLVKIS